MAVISRPTKRSRRIALPGGVRPALSSWWMTALAYLLLLILGYLLITPVIGWGQRRLDDLRYGFPRTTQIDGFVGHSELGGTPTHLIALNLHRHGIACRVFEREAPTLRKADQRDALGRKALA